MPTIRVSPGQLGAVFRGQARRGKKMLEGAMQLAAQRGRSLLVPRTPVDLGQLKAAWRVRRVDGGWVLINEAPHAGIMEVGARPHEVDEEGREALAQWVRRHIPVVETYVNTPKGVFRTKTKATRREAMPGNEPREEIDKIVDAICYRLRARGYKGKFFVRESLPELRAFVGEEVSAAMARHVNNIGGSGNAP